MWSPLQTLFLDKVMWHEGRGSFTNHSQYTYCEEHGMYRCDDCFGDEMYCAGCIVKVYVLLLLYNIKQWNDAFFECTSLKALGLCIQLGHHAKQSCIRPIPVFHVDDFVVVDSNGIHEVGLDFCGCKMAQSRMKQLLQAQLYPTTVCDPRTTATFHVLKQFHLLSFKLKISAYKFYHALNLKMLKRTRRAHDPEGPDHTVLGQYAILCPACPQPGKNLLQDFDKEPASQGWLYMLFIAIDANFRLKCKAVSSNTVDPSLSGRWFYFVEENAYKHHLSVHSPNVQEKSTCSDHSAVNLVDTKPSYGLAATGVSIVNCSCHNMKLPKAVGDLQKGEKYINMDYLFFSALQNFSLSTFFVSYDIACQWSKKLWTRMPTLPPELHFDCTDKQMDFGVLKFHLPVHQESCQLLYSLNFLPGVGWMDGEAPEWGWVNINPVASSMKEMGPGSRRDTLDDFFGDWNWKKVIGMGDALLKKMKEAVMHKNKQEAILYDLEAALLPDMVSEWTTEVEAWKANQEMMNPYEHKHKVMTQAKIRLELARDKTKKLQTGNDISLHSEVSPSVLISSGLDLEDQHAHPTDQQGAKLQQHVNILQCKLEQWSSIQMLYMLLVACQRASDAESAEDIEQPQPHCFKLWLLSERPHLSSNLLLEYEWKLCYAQGLDALEEIRQNLHLRSYLLHFKQSNICGQGANNHAHNTVKVVKVKIKVSAAKYWVAHAALTNVSLILEKEKWRRVIQALKDEDIRVLSVGVEGQSEGHRTISWIWQAPGVSDNWDEDLQDSWWLEQSQRCELSEAFTMYAAWQASLFLSLKSSCYVPDITAAAS
ncbi:hypothetical protein BDN67DRAFT_992063 [Paxillus ammoniavirescens]|nr:hypothetical protein BDN67DRAFT_992063 [Paxillus ammoniavirescens]